MSITTVGIIGAGTMGNGIAQACAVSGIQVIMVDISEAAVGKGLSTVAGSLERLLKKDKISAADKDAALARIKGSTSYDDLKAADLVIEAATENHDLKVKILKQIDAIVAPEVIIASNTSSISITKLAAVTSRPDRFIGMHFFNPVPMMALVEIIRGLQTSDATHDAVQSMAKALGKTPITVKNAPGFVVNRILVPMINEAFFVLAEGLATPEDIDAGMKLGCNQPIGPLALADMVGLDVCLAVMDVYLSEFGDSKYRACPLLKEMVAGAAPAGLSPRRTADGCAPDYHAGHDHRHPDSLPSRRQHRLRSPRRRAADRYQPPGQAQRLHAQDVPGARRGLYPARRRSCTAGGRFARPGRPFHGRARPAHHRTADAARREGGPAGTGGSGASPTPSASN